jgi:hypothetical protein
MMSYRNVGHFFWSFILLSALAIFLFLVAAAAPPPQPKTKK